MSKYTTELRWYCESKSPDLTNTRQIIENSRQYVFDFDYPIDELYRPQLEIDFIRHFYTREICEETIGLWKLRLEDRLNLIGPKYNELYKSVGLITDPLTDTKYTVTENRGENQTFESKKSGNTSLTGKETSNSTTKDDSESKMSDTPQGGLTGLRSDKYLTQATIDSATNTQNATVNTTNNTNTTANENNKQETNANRTETHEGKTGGKSYAELLNEYRETFININAMIIEECNDLFMGVW